MTVGLDAQIREARRRGDREAEKRFRRMRGDEMTEEVWVTEDKRCIPVVDLDDDHLVNCFNYVTRRLFIAGTDEPGDDPYYPVRSLRQRTRRAVFLARFWGRWRAVFMREAAQRGLALE